SLASVQRYDKPLDEATTSSLEALQSITEGTRVFGQKGAADALPFFKHAVELDPKFAAAYARLGIVYSNLGERSRSVENLSRGFELRDRLSQREKYNVVGRYYLEITGELDKASEQFHLAVQEYPRSQFVHNQLGHLYARLGQHEQAAREYREETFRRPESSV